MFTAKNKENIKIYVEDAIKGEEYFCPECNEKVIFKKCTSKASHFAHQIDCGCVDWCDKSEWHLEWQKRFPKEYREVVLDNGKERHRADILIEDKKLVIEFQYSYLPYEEFYRRNLFYTSCGYAIVWIFYANKKLKNIYDYRLNPVNCIQGTKFYFNPSDFLEQKIEWKRRQSTFTNNCQYKQLPIMIFLETNLPNTNEIIFLHVHGINEYDMKVYWHHDYIKLDNLMKWFGQNNEVGVKSFLDIVNESEGYKNNLFKKMKNER